MKMKFSAFFKDVQTIYDIIPTVVSEMSKLVTLAYQFINLHLRWLYENRKEFPVVNALYIRAVLRTVGTAEMPPEEKIEDETKQGVLDFYRHHFIPYDREAIPHDHRSHITHALADDMETGIHTNVKMHFAYYICRWINLTYAIIPRQDRTPIKNALLRRNASLAPEPLRAEIEEKIAAFFPADCRPDKPWEWLLERNPSLFLHSAFTINEAVVECGGRPYNIIPQRSSYIPMYIPLNTSAMADLFYFELKMADNIKSKAEGRRGMGVGRQEINADINMSKHQSGGD
jgi:hypothetical protein